MARIRTVKPDFWTDEKITECSMSARLFFIGLLNFADDNGNLIYSAKKLKMQILPADPIDVEPLIRELITHGVLIEYSMNEHGVQNDNQGIDKKYLHIKGFKKHQTINRPSKSDIPEPDFNEKSVSNHTMPDEHSLNTHGVLIDGKGKGKGNTNNKERSNISRANSPSSSFEDCSKNEQEKETEPEKIEIDAFEVKERAAITTYARSQGIQAVGHQGLDELIAQGATMQHFVDAIPIGKNKGKSSWRYILGIVRGMLDDAKNAHVPQQRANPQAKFDPVAWVRDNPASQQHGLQPIGNFIDIPMREVTHVE